jgi:hypothetical protein
MGQKGSGNSGGVGGGCVGSGVGGGGGNFDDNAEDDCIRCTDLFNMTPTDVRTITAIGELKTPLVS